MPYTDVATDSFESDILQTINTALGAGGVALAAWDAYAGLLSAVTDAEAATFTEITGANGLARQQFTRTAVSQVSGAGEVSNSAQINFGTFTGGAAVTATHVILATAAAGGTTRVVCQLENPVTINPNDPVIFPVNQLKLRVS
jgi:hypothetical protein